MNKFSIQSIPKYDKENPVLYKVMFGNNYYLHKGKDLRESVDRFLDDIFRGMRDKKYNEAYSEVIKHCKAHPSLYKVSIEIILNAEAPKILRKEDKMYREMKKDSLSLNRKDILPYKPEWMIKEGLQKRCENCLKTGNVEGRKVNFKFCPQCGRLNK